MQRCIYRCLTYCPPTEVMHFVFDGNSDKQLKALMIDRFDRVKHDLLEANDEHFGQIGELTFAGSVNAPQLQAADLLAYQAHRYGKEANGDKDHQVRPEFGAALARFKLSEDFWIFDSVSFDHLNRLYAYIVEEELENAKQQQS